MGGRCTRRFCILLRWTQGTRAHLHVNTRFSMQGLAQFLRILWLHVNTSFMWSPMHRPMYRKVSPAPDRRRLVWLHVNTSFTWSLVLFFVLQTSQATQHTVIVHM